MPEIKQPQRPVVQQMQHMKVSLALIPHAKLIISDKDLHHPLGIGGFGTVFKGKWQGISVAIKRLHLTQMTKTALKEFKSEATIMASVNHLNTLRLYGVCLEHGRYSLVTPLMTMGSLSQLLHSGNKLPWSLRYQISRDIACGLSYLHSCNILHRDLKSLNVLLDNQLQAKLCDFGLSRLKQETNAASSRSKAVVGTLAWMAPELFKRHVKYTKHADIYSFGMILWEIASRKLPFSDATHPGVLRQWIERGEKEELPDNTPKEFAQLIVKCWNKVPSERYSADKIVTILDGIINQTKLSPPSNNSAEVLKSTGMPLYRHFTAKHKQ